MKIKILGAGSAGCHLAHAARQLGWDVLVTDEADAALDRMPAIYAERYGAWDEAIDRRYVPPEGKFDLACIATPPETHVALALYHLDRQIAPRILIEKPLCTVGQIEGAKLLRGREVFVGYGYPLIAKHFTDFAKLHVRWCEHWQYVLKAHPWLKDIHDSYLGVYWRGGGALSEHSHGLNLWQHYAREAGKGEVVKVDAEIEYENDHDVTAFLMLTTDTGFVGYVTQDVVSRPPLKWAQAMSACECQKQSDSFWASPFKAVLEHVATADPETSPLSLENGLRTAMIISAAHRSAREGQPIDVDVS